MSFRKKTWSLTIEQIKCKFILRTKNVNDSISMYIGVDCPVDDIGPRSVLILCYKGQYTSVHV
jgi:hypothetical protein